VKNRVLTLIATGASEAYVRSLQSNLHGNTLTLAFVVKFGE